MTALRRAGRGILRVLGREPVSRVARALDARAPLDDDAHPCDAGASLSGDARARGA
jgi:hypothetical protein